MTAPRDKPSHTPAQLKAIWAKARERGLTDAELRALTPRGHLRDLTYLEAHALLNQLGESRPAYGRVPGTAPLPEPVEGRRPEPVEGRRPEPVEGRNSSKRLPRLHPGDVRLLTAAQRAQIDRLQRQLADLYGWSDDEMRAWLAARRFKHDPNRRMSEPNTSADGAAVLQLLYHVIPQAKAARAEQARAARDRASLPKPAPPPEAPPADSLFADHFQHRRQRIAADATTS